MKKQKLGTIMGEELDFKDQYCEEGIYSEEGVIELLGDDELSPKEAAFMQGYDLAE